MSPSTDARQDAEKLPCKVQWLIKLVIFVSASHQTEFDTRSDDLKVGSKWRLEKGKVRHKPRLKLCWTMLDMGPSLGPSTDV